MRSAAGSAGRFVVSRSLWHRATRRPPGLGHARRGPRRSPLPGALEPCIGPTTRASGPHSRLPVPVSCHYWDAKTTRRVDSHSRRLAIHTGMGTYPRPLDGPRPAVAPSRWSPLSAAAGSNSPAAPDPTVRSRRSRRRRAGDPPGHGENPRRVRRASGRHEVQRRAREAAAPVACTGTCPAVRHASTWQAMRLAGARPTPALDCANDTEGQCALWPSGHAHSCYGATAGAEASCGPAFRPAVAGRNALPVTGATPFSRPRGGVDPCVVSHPRPRRGSPPIHGSLRESR